jgi:3-phytase
MRILMSLVALALLAPLTAVAQVVEVRPSLETQPGVLATGTQAVDVGLWVNPLNQNQSLLLVADTSSGLVTFTLEGNEFQLIPDGVVSGVDVQEGVLVAGTVQPLVVTANRTLNGLVPYVINPQTRGVSRVDPNQVLRATNFASESVTLYRSASGRLYAFSGNNSGAAPALVQLELNLGQDGGVSGTEVRRITLDSPATGLVADDEQGFVFIAERNHGISRLPAEPDAGTGRTFIAGVTGGLPGAPVGGVALYRGSGTAGYLVVANTPSDTFLVLDRRPPHAQVGSFRLGQDGGIDPVTGPRSLELTSRSLGTLFPQGLLIAHDDSNAPVENYKLASWTSVANAFNPPLTNVEGGADGGTADGGRDGGSSSGPGGPLPSLPPDDPSSGCGCSTASVPGLVLVTLLGLALGRRRRS